MITIVVLYLLIYLLVFAFMQTLVDADVSVSVSRAACRQLELLSALARHASPRAEARSRRAVAAGAER